MIRFCMIVWSVFWVCPLAAETFWGRDVSVYSGAEDRGHAPMVLLLHGALGTGAQVLDESGYRALADEFGLLVVAPDGIRRRWLDGRHGLDPTDVNYLAALIDAFVARGLADPDAIYVVGHSNGGGMAMRLACDRPDLVQGIGVVATKALAAYPCSDGAPVPAIFFHGTQDRISPHAGRPEGHRLGETLSAAATLDLWMGRNGCAAPGSSQRIDTHPNDGTALDIVAYARCDAALMHVVIEGGGHGWPGAASGGPLAGRLTREIDAGRASLRFFGF